MEVEVEDPVSTPPTVGASKAQAPPPQQQQRKPSGFVWKKGFLVGSTEAGGKK